jgi:formamidopyrimidine-DNA glycosylase
VPEGHTLHRLATAVREHFAGAPVAVSSPQGRFADSAALLDGSVLVDAQAHGKHLFVEFAEERLVHVHLGLYGKLDIHTGPAPEAVGQVRMRLVRDAPPSAYGDLRGATACDLVTAAQRDLIEARLGPDPLREDADWTRAWDRVASSRAPIGGLLMDQTVLAGVGNVYRAELLYRHRVSPFRPGRDVDAGLWAAMWADLVTLMRAGVRMGRIVTTLPQDRSRRGGAVRRDDAHYVYRRTGLPCRVCGTGVRTEVMVGRNLYWCPLCQVV